VTARLALAGAALLALTSCSGSSSDCQDTAAGAASATTATTCHDLVFNKVPYDEWHIAHPGPILKELGDATYPRCNATGCHADAFDGLEATDVWAVDGVRPGLALLGIQEGSDSYVVYVRAGVDPATIVDRIDPALLGG
jgi:hypothetical protein